MSEHVDFLPILGLTIDAVGAIVIVLPDIAPFKRHLLWTKNLRAIRDVRNEVADGGSFLRGEDDYKILMDAIYNETGATRCPYEVNVHIPDHPSDGGTLRFVIEESSASDSDMRGIIAKDEQERYFTTARVSTWLDREIERKQGQLRQHYLRVGVIVLAIGFSIQAISRASSSLLYLILALAASVVPFLFLHTVLNQDLDKV